MKRSVPLLLAAVWLSLTGLAAEKPNILLITGDDLGFQLGCYGDKAAHTPNMDRLAQNGMRFTRGYVTQASCSSSRSSLLTGFYPHQNGQIGLAHLGYAMPDPNVPKLPNLLKSAGYYTGIMGKLHVAPEPSFTFDFKGGGYNETRNPERVAADFKTLIEQTPTGAPWFAYVNFADPHHPHNRDVAGHPKTKIEAGKVPLFPFFSSGVTTTLEELADFYTCIARMDEGVGYLMDILKEIRQENNTIVILIGDNGPPFSRAKVTSFEAGVNVPFVIAWPGKIKDRQVSDKLVCTIDILPTLLPLAKTEVPAGLPGKSLWPLLTGENTAWREWLATEYTSHEPRSFGPQRSIRDAQYKLTITLLKDPAFKWPPGINPEEYRKIQPKSATGEWIEFYDLKTDPYEFKNLANEPSLAAVKDKLWKNLQSWREETKDPLLSHEAIREQIIKHKDAQPTPVPAWRKAAQAAKQKK